MWLATLPVRSVSVCTSVGAHRSTNSSFLRGMRLMALRHSLHYHHSRLYRQTEVRQAAGQEYSLIRPLTTQGEGAVPARVVAEHRVIANLCGRRVPRLIQTSSRLTFPTDSDQLLLWAVSMKQIRVPVSHPLLTSCRLVKTPRSPVVSFHVRVRERQKPLTVRQTAQISQILLGLYSWAANPDPWLIPL